MFLHKTVLIASLILFCTAVVFSQGSHYKRIKRIHCRTTVEQYQRMQSSMDDRIKNLENEISQLKKQKIELKKQYLNILEQRIKEKDADIARLKKERNEVQSVKTKVRGNSPDRRKQALDKQLNNSGREVLELNRMKEKVDSIKAE